jgi:hypothetical protein
MIQSGEAMIGREIVYADSIDLPKLDYGDYSDGRLFK